MSDILYAKDRAARRHAIRNAHATQVLNRQRAAREGAVSANSQLPNINLQENRTMATPTTSNQKPANQKPAPAVTKPATTKPTTTTEEGKSKKSKKERVRLVSSTNPNFWVRAYKEVIEKHGMPRGPSGEEMVVKAFTPIAKLSDEEKAARAKAKEAAKAAFEAMSPEQKAEFAAKRRAELAAKRDAKKLKEKEALIALVEAAVKAGKDPMAALRGV